jgi:hypothetical protein
MPRRIEVNIKSEAAVQSRLVTSLLDASRSAFWGKAAPQPRGLAVRAISRSLYLGAKQSS